MRMNDQRSLPRLRGISSAAVGFFLILLLFVIQRTSLHRALEGVMIQSSASVSAGLGKLGAPFAFFGNVFGDARALREENKRLLEENRALLETITTLRSFENENRSLRALLNSSIISGDGSRVRITNVIGSAGRRPKEVFYIRGGSADGIASGDIVMLPEKTLLGTVTKTAERVSVVETVLSREFKVAVRIGPGRAEGLFEGGVKSSVSLIPKNARINDGDLVTTSGQDGNVPAGLLIGRIRNIVSFPAEAFQKGELEFPFFFSDIDEVAVQKNFFE